MTNKKMRYEIYTKTEKAWDAMLRAISHAKKSIFIEMYIFENNTSDTHDFIEILRKKALSGVSVKIILDSFGSSNLSDSSVKKLREAGVELLFFKRTFRVTHRKMLVIDERMAFIGGVNIGKFFKDWDDILIMVESKVVGYILRSFARAYKDWGGKDMKVLKYCDRKISPFQKSKMWFLEHLPPGNSLRLKKYYRDKIESAEDNILIVTPYFMPNDWIIKAIRKASKRGVKVEIIIPRFATEPKIANIPNYFYMHKLHKCGINFFLTREMNHSKIMLIDGLEGIIGSQNLDMLSFDMNMESGVFFTEPDIISDLGRITDEWKKDAIPYSPDMRITNSLDIVMDACFGFFEHVIMRFLNKISR